MGRRNGYRVEALSFLRKAVIASASVTGEKNVIHLLSEVDVTLALRLLDENRIEDGSKLSFTSFLAKSFGETIVKHPDLNSFIAGNRQVFIEDINISVLVERNAGKVSVPEPMVLRNVEGKEVRELSAEIRAAQRKASESGALGDLSQSRWFRHIPGFLLKAFIRIADGNIKMGIRYGKLAITNIGMFSARAVWVIPHGSATVLLTVGGIAEKDERKKLCLTVSFDHDVVDGAPAARFVDDLVEELESAKCLLGLRRP